MYGNNRLANVTLNRKTAYMHSIYCPRAVNKITNDHVAAIYQAYQADIDLSLEGFRREVARLRTRWPLQNGMICQQHFVPYLIR
jgi:hypothetical protein